MKKICALFLMFLCSPTFAGINCQLTYFSSLKGEEFESKKIDVPAEQNGFFIATTPDNKIAVVAAGADKQPDIFLQISEAIEPNKNNLPTHLTSISPGEGQSRFSYNKENVAQLHYSRIVVDHPDWMNELMKGYWG